MLSLCAVHRVLFAALVVAVGSVQAAEKPNNLGHQRNYAPYHSSTLTNAKLGPTGSAVGGSSFFEAWPTKQRSITRPFADGLRSDLKLGHQSAKRPGH